MDIKQEINREIFEEQKAEQHDEFCLHIAKEWSSTWHDMKNGLLRT